MPVPYVPGNPPTDPNQLSNWLLQELTRLAETLNSGLEQFHVEPENPYNGQIVIADGTDWNPGGGRGVYWYDEDGPTTWTKL